MIFKTSINGIPCFCRVDRYSPGAPAKLGGPMEDADPGYDEEMDYTILDQHYRIATWLQKQVTDQDDERLREEYHCTLLEQKYLYKD